MKTDPARSDIELCELAAPAFLHALPALIDVYAAAMEPAPEQLAGRRTIMERHARHPRFQAVVASAHKVSPAPPSAPTQAGSDTAEPGGRRDEPAVPVLGFAYGFHGQGGQWWHDIVTGELRARATLSERRWLARFADSFEIAEVHVHPRHQGRGLGRLLLERLTAARSERTAVLSTHSGPTTARGLYRSCGFTDVLGEFYFPGSPHQPFTIMAARLPLRARGGRRSARRSHVWPWTG